MGDYLVAGVQQDALGSAQLELGGSPNSLALRRPFDPLAHDLEASFRLTRFADLKGRGCKVPQEVLYKLVEGLLQDHNAAAEHEHAHFMHMSIPRIGIGLDCSVGFVRFIFYLVDVHKQNMYNILCFTSDDFHNIVGLIIKTVVKTGSISKCSGTCSFVF